MDALTLAQLRTHILFRAKLKINNLDPSNDATSGATNLNRIINLWKDKIISLHDFNWKRGMFQLDTASTFRHDIPSTVGRVLSVRDIGNSRILKKTEFARIYENDPDLSQSSDPEWYCFPESTTDKPQIGFWPIGAITVSIGYDKAFQDLVDDAQTLEDIGVPGGSMGLFQGSLIEGVLVDVFDYLNDSMRSVSSFSKYKGNLGELIEQDTNMPGNTYILKSWVQERPSVGRFPANYPAGS